MSVAIDVDFISSILVLAVAVLFLTFSLELENLDFKLLFRRDTVEEKVDVVSMEALSTSLAGLDDSAGMVRGVRGGVRISSRVVRTWIEIVSREKTNNNLGS
jgi:hypothetical protein